MSVLRCVVSIVVHGIGTCRALAMMQGLAARIDKQQWRVAVWLLPQFVVACTVTAVAIIRVVNLDVLI